MNYLLNSSFGNLLTYRGDCFGFLFNLIQIQELKMNEPNRAVLLAVSDLKKIAEVLRKNQEFQLAELIEDYINLPPSNKCCESNADDLNRIIRNTITVGDLMRLILKLFGDF